jgi:multidrug transporter EmrE-like cation transporter
MIILNLVYGILYGIIGQVLSFIQLQAGVKWGWTEKWSWALMLLGLPISWAFMKSVQNFIVAFNGETWPSRLAGFGIGVVVFSILSWLMFNEGLSLKTIVCLILALGIILVQVLWK